MAITHNQTDLLKLKQNRKKAQAVQSATALIFNIMAENGEISNTDITAHAALCEIWQAGLYRKGNIRRCPQDNQPYRCTHNNHSTTAPSKDTNCWAKI